MRIAPGEDGEHVRADDHNQAADGPREDAERQAAAGRIQGKRAQDMKNALPDCSGRAMLWHEDAALQLAQHHAGLFAGRGGILCKY